MPSLETSVPALDAASFDSWPGLQVRGSLGRRYAVLLDELLGEVNDAGLLAPRLAYESHLVAAVERNGIRLAGGAYISGLAHAARRFRGARELVAAVGTIGVGLETEVSRLFRQRQAARALVLEEIGVFALFRHTNAMIAAITSDAASRSLAAGRPVLPGDQGMALGLQPLACTLAGAERIAVRANEAGMIVPVNSISMMIGVGEDAPVEAVNDCDICKARERCRYRNHKNRWLAA